MYICFAVNLNFVLSRQGTKLKNTFLPFFSVYFNLITQPVNWSSVHFVFCIFHRSLLPKPGESPESGGNSGSYFYLVMTL